MNGIYAGQVAHNRPGMHRLRYSVFMLALDLDEIGALGLKLPGHNRAALLSYHDRDHAAPIDAPVKPQIEARLRQSGLAWDGGHGGWYVITIPTTYSPDGTGWVSATYVTLQGATPADLPIVQPPPPPEEVIPPAPETGSLVVQTTEPVNVRAGPGNEYPSYGKVPAGTPLQAVGINQEGTWVAVLAPVPSGIG